MIFLLYGQNWYNSSTRFKEQHIWRLTALSAYQVQHNFINPTDCSINTIFCTLDDNTVTLWWSPWKAHGYTAEVLTDLPNNFTTSSDKMSMMARINTNLTFRLALLQHHHTHHIRITRPDGMWPTTWVDSAFYPLWDGKMSINFQAE